MAKKKSSAKSITSATSKRSGSKASQKPKSKSKTPKQKQIKFPKEKKTTVLSKKPAQTKKSKYSKPSPSSSTTSRSTKPRVRNFKKTYLFKDFKKKFGKDADKKYWKKVERYWQTEYDKKKRPATIVKAGITKKFVRTIKNRFKETKKSYMGVSAWKKGKDGKWKRGKAVKRYFWKDKLTGELLRGKRVGARIRKVMEPDLIRGYMRKHGLKNYQKARKRFLKETKNTSIRTIVWLYGASP